MKHDILAEVEREIPQLGVEQQKKLLADLPRLLKIPLDDLFLLKIAQHSFDFWNNQEDSIYDTL
mgnify:CR=1 FL=1